MKSVPYRNKLTYLVSAANRWRKYQLFLDVVQPAPATTILDVGFIDQEYRDTENFLEKVYPHRGQITALGIDSPVLFQQRYPDVRAVTYDGRVFPFGDGEFDVCWSNAVIEHVGGPDRQLLFLQEMLRTSRMVFFSTPNRWFPLELHTRVPLLHYLPKRVFDALLRGVGRPRWTGDELQLLSARGLESLLERAGARDFRLYRNKFLGFTMDFVVVASVQDTG